MIPICDREETNYELAVEDSLSLSPRGTSGEREGERGAKRPPLPGPLLLVGGEGVEARIQSAQSRGSLKTSVSI